LRTSSAISAYLEKKQSVWVFFDNLDKGWSTQGVEVIDAIVLRCLVDAGRKVEREMRRNKHEFHCIVFVRNDVYDHVMRQSPDYGKEMRATLDWSDADMLREMLRLRLVSNLAESERTIDFFTIWRQLCDPHYGGTEEPKQENIMRKIMLLGVSSLVIVCSAFGADARSSDEEDSPQASTQPGYTWPLHRSPSSATLHAGRKSPASSHGPAGSRQQEDINDRGY
jgi:hypothetical protein